MVAISLTAPGKNIPIALYKGIDTQHCIRHICFYCEYIFALFCRLVRHTHANLARVVCLKRLLSKTVYDSDT